ncbi:hypothetical protein DIPPA_35106 [Diplonema papillatum]|nr:hypothetical protein DIPPA_35106 [Diplonema papillatum]
MTPVVEAPRPANEEERKADAPDSAVAAADEGLLGADPAQREGRDEVRES